MEFPEYADMKPPGDFNLLLEAFLNLPFKIL